MIQFASFVGTVCDSRQRLFAVFAVAVVICLFVPIHVRFVFGLAGRFLHPMVVVLRQYRCFVLCHGG